MILWHREHDLFTLSWLGGYHFNETLVIVKYHLSSPFSLDFYTSSKYTIYTDWTKYSLRVANPLKFAFKH